MSTGSSTHQTLSFLIERFRQVGIRPYGKLGQNFLIDMNLQRILLDAAQLGPDDVVLEIGTGTGALTALMAPAVASVVTVELDRQLFQLAGEELFRLKNVVMVQADALKNKNRLNPAVVEAIQEQLAAAPGRRLKLVANLPYNIATPIITNLLALDSPPASMTFTVQKEVAERIVAQPGTKDYGSLAIWLQSQCRTEILRILPPSVFWPRPKVASAFVQITLDESRRKRIPDLEFFHSFARTMFFHRRKFIRSELLSGFKELEKPVVDKILLDLGLDGTIRAEVLDIEAMLALCESVRAAVSPH